jgi:hypothetical protein
VNTRSYGYGYRPSEVELPAFGEIKEGTRFQIKSVVDDYVTRRPVLVGLGCEMPGVALPHADLDDRDTLLSGACKRAACRMPDYDPTWLVEMEAFALDLCEKYFVPLPLDTDISVEHWLEGRNYTQARKEELLEASEEMHHWTDSHRYIAVGGFAKDECYADFKQARLIHTRDDHFKVACGPIFSAIESQVFKHPYFIKKIPIAERPNYIRDLLGVEGLMKFMTDYTSMEATFIAELMESIEFVLYKFFTKNLNSSKDFLRMLDVLCGENEISYKKFRMWLKATRMSGEMNTSIGNGVANWFIMEFVCHKVGCTLVKAVFEGDDGLGIIVGPEHDRNLRPSVEDFAKMGAKVKLEYHARLETGSFCGLIFDPEECINVTNPVEVLAGFGWTSRQYMRARSSRLRMLARSKALSYAHQYPGCPIISEMAHYVLRSTSGIDVRHYVKTGKMDMWTREQLLDALDSWKVPRKNPGMKTRLLVEELFNISVERQMKIEAWFHARSDLEPFPAHLVVDLAPKSWHDYYEKYVYVADYTSQELVKPLQFGVVMSNYITAEQWLASQGFLK